MSLQVETDPARPNTYIFVGDLDEHAKDALFELRSQPLLAGVRFDLGGVGRINSVGTMYWTTFIRGLPETLSPQLERCSAVFVQLVRMMPGALGRGVVTSGFAEAFCDPCHLDVQALVTLARDGQPGPDVELVCPECGKMAGIISN